MKRLFTISFYLVGFLYILFPENLLAQQNLEAWHTQGQTFLIWEHSEPLPPDTTYDIYTSTNPITSIENATWIGRIFSNNGSNYRLNEYIPDARWKLPTASETITVGSNQAYFVVTPHEIDSSYYAVVLTGLTAVGPENSAGPVEETTDPITCSIQYIDNTVTIYGHWLDGRADYNSGRPDYPVMGNEYSNGVGANFAEWIPVGGYPSGNLPLNICLHGGMDNLFLSGSLPYIGSYFMPNGYFVSLDDALPAREPLSPEYMNINTFWFGYNKNYCRFSPTYPASQDTVVNYTIKRIHWETNWLIDNLSIDTTRISAMGFSMGANGLGLLTQFYPELYSAVLVFVPRGAGTQYPARNRLVGFPYQNLPTTLDGNPGIYDAINWFWRLQNIYKNGANWPYTIIVSGKNDVIAGWSEKPELYTKLDSAATGFALYWDEREHINWDGAHFKYSRHLIPQYLSEFRTNQSFPAFSTTDTNLEIPGRQPYPGNGEPQNGDPWGTWGGYIEWDSETITDTQDCWEVTIWVVWESLSPCDITDADTILASITPRRLQFFQPEPGAEYSWCLKKVTGEILQQGTVVADPEGNITVPNLLLIKDYTKLTITENTGINGAENTTGHAVIISEPNPFQNSTTLHYTIPFDCLVTIKIYDLTGRLVDVLVNEFQTAGNHSILWEGISNKNTPLYPGMYFSNLETNNEAINARMLLL